MKTPRRSLVLACLPLLWSGAARARAQPVVPVELNFVAEVNGEPFDCAKTYANVGKDAVRWQPQDLRFYVSEVALLRADGSRIPVSLVADGTWQTREVALLDFENRTGSCQNGTPATRTQLRGTVPSDAGAVGLAFKVAVPFAANHADASTQDPPLDQAGLFWSWQMGYKFLNVEGRANGTTSFAAHIGSTGCSMAKPNVVDDCRARNEVEVRLPKFDRRANKVVADVGRLLAGSTLGQSAAKGVGGNALSGCMSEFNNPRCAAIFANLGLPFAGQAAAEQTFLQVK